MTVPGKIDDAFILILIVAAGLGSTSINRTSGSTAAPSSKSPEP